MRAVVNILLAGAALLCAACGSGSDDPHAGIEIGNPTVGLAAQFVLDYGDPDYGPLLALAKQPAADEPVVVSDLSLGLSEVRHYSSYYVSAPVDPLQGLRIWPRPGFDTLVAMTFDATGSSNLSFTEWKMPSGGLLKEIGFVVRPTSDSNGVIRGSLRTSLGLVPFEYSLSGWESLQLRFHAAQVEAVNDTLSSLPIRFHVPLWVQGVDFSTALPDSDGVVRFGPLSNSVQWKILASQFPSSFNCLRWFQEDEEGHISNGYSPFALASFDKPGTNWVRDTAFTQRDSNWIFIRQFDGAATVSYAGGKALFDISEGGSEVFSIQFIQENIPIIAGKTYRISFRASSNIGSEIIARIGIYHSPYYGLSPEFYFGIYDQLGYYDRTFTASETSMFGRLEFNLGGKRRQVTLSDIRVEQLD